jgi:hypothetical protein
MTFLPDTTALLAADRRGRREAAARRFRLFSTRRAATTGARVPRLPAPAGRTPAGAAAPGCVAAA